MQKVELHVLVARVMDDRFSPGRIRSIAGQTRKYAESLESWRKRLPKEVAHDTDRESLSVWGCLLELVYK